MPAGLLGIAAAAAVWASGGGDLSWTRLLAGGAVWMVVQALGSAVIGYVLGRRGLLS
ncbi:hypothetical protein OH809_44450 (plasmid) [Streptomyces sp. NBC_00873]|uniref:hypothetical protein n=1 Tax=unclassified Streptomyces TaxID=2593676 RepID=UPI002F91612C|nr:hypothetical protein OH809_44450 [Streptomyces sp. NBC_00873]WTA49287.1 hypothetical protein OH821_44190 [Streptomyces sp. NBC_00842]